MAGSGNARVTSIYVAQSPDGNVKVGITTNLMTRRYSLGAGVKIIRVLDDVPDASNVEFLAHRILASDGCHVRGEWFKATIDRALYAIDLARRQSSGEQLSLGADMSKMRNVSNKHKSKRVSYISIALTPDDEAVIDVLRRRAGYPTPSKADIIRAALNLAVMFGGSNPAEDIDRPQAIT